MTKPIVHPLSQPVRGVGGPTGTWRTSRPVLDPKKCNACLLCWIFCPEGVISKENRSVDYELCKGCGICAVECPQKAFTMIKEEGR